MGALPRPVPLFASVEGGEGSADADIPADVIKIIKKKIKIINYLSILMTTSMREDKM